jgi:hypothetical protein
MIMKNMIMRNWKIIFFSMIFALCTFSFYSCSTDDDEEENLTIPERIAQFINDLNTNRANAHRNLYDSMGSKYKQIAGKTDYWDSAFGGSPRNLAVAANSENTTITGGTLGGSKTIVFTMQQVGNNYLIASITLAGSSIYP